MGPTLSVDNHSDSTMVTPEHFGKGTVCMFASRIKSSYLNNLSLSKLGQAVFLAPVIKRRLSMKNIVGMVHILLSCHIFKIFEAIVGLISIFMINFHTFWAWTYKGSHDNTVYGEPLVFIVPGEVYRNIAIFFLSLFHYVTNFMLLSGSPRGGFHDTRTTNFIAIFKANNWFPEFFHDFSPSGVIIKQYSTIRSYAQVRGHNYAII